MYLLGLLAVLLLLEVTICVPGLWSERLWGSVWLFAVGTGALLVTAGLVARHAALERGAIKLVRLGGIAAAAFIGLWLSLCLFPGDRNLFFAFRARELRLGSSPAWPVIAALLAVALYAFIHLSRCYIAVCQKPAVITANISSALAERLRGAWRDFNAILKSPLGLRFRARSRVSREPFVLGVVCGVLLLGIAGLFQVVGQLRTIDNRSYNGLVLSLQFLVVALLLLTCVQVRLLWRSFQSFLASLRTLPFSRAFRPVDKPGADRPLWVRHLNLQSIDIHIEGLYRLHNMTTLGKRVLEAGEPDVEPWQREYLKSIEAGCEEYTQGVRQLLKLGRQRSREEVFRLRNVVRDVNRSIATETFNFLQHAWRTKPLKPPNASESTDKNAGKKKAKPLDQIVELGERFVALHYSSYILYCVRQIQNLFIFLSSGFVLLMISLNCYSIQSRQFAGRLLFILFAIIGAATISCLSGLEKDVVLSRIAGSEPGKLNSSFYLKMLAYGGVPALGLLASQFPSIANFLFSWVEPTLETLK
jgi:hypothetical protein